MSKAAAKSSNFGLRAARSAKGTLVRLQSAGLVRVPLLPCCIAAGCSPKYKNKN